MEVSNDRTIEDFEELSEEEADLITENDGVVGFRILRGFEGAHQLVSPMVQHVRRRPNVQEEDLRITLHEPATKVHLDAVLLLHDVDQARAELGGRNLLELSISNIRPGTDQAISRYKTKCVEHPSTSERTDGVKETEKVRTIVF